MLKFLIDQPSYLFCEFLSLFTIGTDKESTVINKDSWHGNMQAVYMYFTFNHFHCLAESAENKLSGYMYMTCTVSQMQPKEFQIRLLLEHSDLEVFGCFLPQI